jgi:hypothetical protein
LITGAEALITPGRVQPIYLEGKLPIAQASTAVELGLNEGQVVHASVKLQDQQPMLFLQGRALPATGLQLPEVGESMWLRVQNGALVPISTPHLISRIATLLYRPNVNSALPQILQAGKLDSLIENLQRPDLQSQWRSLQLSMAQITPSMIRQSMLSAMGAEVWLARGVNPPVADTKQLLRRIIAELSSNPSEDTQDTSLIEKLTQSVDDIESSQVQAVQAQAQQEILFSMTLPFVDADPIEMNFRRGPRQDGESPVLTVNIHSKSTDLGPIWLKTQLMSAEQIDLTMWAESEDVVAQARARGHLLGEELSGAGLNMRSFSVIHGPRPLEPNDWTPSGRGLVVDLTA